MLAWSNRAAQAVNTQWLWWGERPYQTSGTFPVTLKEFHALLWWTWGSSVTVAWPEVVPAGFELEGTTAHLHMVKLLLLLMILMVEMFHTGISEFIV